MLGLVAGMSYRCSLEELETRAPAAVAAFHIHLFRDVDGQPGAEITNDTVEVGQDFFLAIDAQEFAPYYHGLQTVSLDISWDPRAFEVGEPLITPLLPAFRSGRLDSAAGTLTNVSGTAVRSSETGRPIGAGVSERFVLLHVRALEVVVDSRIHLQTGRFQTVTVPTATPGRFEMDFERQLISVVDAVFAIPPQPGDEDFCGPVCGR